MLGQEKGAKVDEFIETMPKLIQTHLVTEKTWAAVTKKAKELEHIIRKGDPPVTASTSMQAAAIPSLYSHIVQSDDHKANNVPTSFNSTKGRGGKKSGKGKQKQQQQHQQQQQHKNNPLPLPKKKGSNNMIRLVIITAMITIAVTAEATDPTGTKAVVGGLTEEITLEAEASKVITMANFIITEANTTPPMVDITITLMGIIGEEVVTAMAVIITEAVVMAEVIVRAITIITTNIMLMMMAIRWNSMDHHVHFAVVLITLLNIA